MSTFYFRLFKILHLTCLLRYKRGAKMHVKVANVELEYMNELKSIPAISWIQADNWKEILILFKMIHDIFQKSKRSIFLLSISC